VSNAIGLGAGWDASSRLRRTGVRSLCIEDEGRARVANPEDNKGEPQMRSIKLAMLALFAVFAFGAIAATSASALPEFKNTSGKTEVSVSGLSVGTQTLRGENVGQTGTITCNTVLVHATILVPSMIIHKVLVEFHGSCKQKIGTNEGTCTEPIVVKPSKGEIGLINSTTKVVGLLLKPESGTEFVTVKCTNGNTKVEGEVVGEIPEKSGLTNQYNKPLGKFEVVFKSSGGTVNQERTEILLLPTQMTGINLKVSGFFGGNASQESTSVIDLPNGETGEITT
jgi:hypothetical protein